MANRKKYKLYIKNEEKLYEDAENEEKTKSYVFGKYLASNSDFLQLL